MLHPPMEPTPMAEAATQGGGGSTSTVVAVVAGILAGIVVTPVAVFAAVISVGPCHGGRGCIPELFPIPELLVEADAGPAALVLGLVQFPVYGGLIGYCAMKGRWALLIALVCVAFPHALAILANGL